MKTQYLLYSLALAGLFHSLAFVPELSAETTQLVPFYQWHNPLLGDYFSTTDPIWSPSRGTQVGDYRYQRTEGRIFSPLAPAPADTVPLYHWFSAARGDNFTTANPAWVPNGGTRDAGYIFIRTQGFVFNKPLAGTVPLHSWYNAAVGDNFATGDPSWIGQTGVTREGYGYYRTEGWMYPSATNEPPHGSRAFGHGTMEILGKKATGRRPLVVIMNKYTPQPFYPPHTADYYRRLIHGPGDRTIAGYFTADSYGKFTWSDGGMVWLEVPYDGGAASPYHTTLFQAAAAAGIDFSRFDSNGDGVVTTDELAVLVIHADPRGADCGNTAFIVPIQASGVRLQPMATFVSQGVGFATIAHELAHHIGLVDIYGTPSINGGYSLAGGTCAGRDDVHQYFHLDPWHKIRLGWIEPRIFSIASPQASVLLDAPQWDGEPNNRPVLLYDPARGTNEFFLLECRNRGTGTVGNYDTDVPSSGLVIWAVRTQPNGDLMQVNKILGGADRVLQTRPRAGSDDIAVDTTFPANGTPDVIRPGPDGLLQTTPTGDDSTGLFDAHCFVMGRRNLGRQEVTWGGGTAWQSGDFLHLDYYDGTPSGIVVFVGPSTNGGNTINVMWKPFFSPNFQSRLDCLSTTLAGPCDFVTLSGMFPVSRTSVDLVSGTGRHAVNVAHWDPTTIRFEIPFGVPTGDYSVEVGTSPAAGNRLPLRVQNFPQGTARIASVLRIGSATRLTWTSTRSGTPTSRCVVFEASTDLRNWTTIATNRPFGPPPWAFLDTADPASRRFYRINQGPFSASDVAPDLIVREIVATGAPTVISGGRVEWPVRVVVRNQGNDSSSRFKIAVVLTVPAASRDEQVPFTVPGQADTAFPWTTLSAGAETTFTGKVTFGTQYRGASIMLFAKADSCIDDGLMPSWCRVRESYEFNNDSSGIALRIP